MQGLINIKLTQKKNMELDD